MSKVNVELILENLSCANCAQKIEEKVAKLSFAEDVSLNFVTKKLSAKVDQNYHEIFIESVKKIVNEIEPEVRVLVAPKEKSILNIGDISALVISSIFFGIGVLTKRENFALIFFILSYFLSGKSVILNFFKNLRKFQVFDENFLMTVATLSAILLKEYPEAASVMLLYKIGQILEDVALNKSRKTIQALKHLEIEYANLKIGNSIRKVNPKDIVPYDIVVVKPGERVPVDGIVVSGKSFLDTSAITGESKLFAVQPNDKVLAGSVVVDGFLEVKAQSFYKDSALHRIVEIVENASVNKSKTEKFITRFAKVYTPSVVIIAIILAILPPLLFDQPFSLWIYRAAIFLIISCPCSLVISVPLSYFASISKLSSKGILVKGSQYIDILASKIGSFLFDKTGTITNGTLSVEKIVPVEISQQEFLKILISIESLSNHPIAKSILSQVEQKDISLSSVQELKEHPGRGIEGIVEGKKVLIGTKEFLQENGVKIEYSFEKSPEFLYIYVSCEGKFCGYVALKDSLKDDVKKVFNRLKSLGSKIYILTGDKKEAAEKIVKDLPIDGIYSELLPEEKVRIAEKIKLENKELGYVVYVGDGTNDSPVLSVCDVGISFVKNSSYLATLAADIVLLDEKLYKIVDLIKDSRFTRKIVIQNIVLSLGIKFAVMFLGILGVANLWEAVVADTGAMLLAVLNSLRVLKR
ncbi:heavy metal translocating P-type ATPase [Caldicellulosiruptor kronotskyensis 2002]|uniref:Cd(2+)-exporting ATPase n=1 Tax=Caldicellulosiruptor kronotskyensis (strain DSM 18902 / VKM B-2412 / 2002) TaxID=632348 RepID=E4SHA6_CALK2|nr:heavy metal translocating P-type ATPase [Caldicellulosiruptor kronotskyensis]ADQ47131.1 heavy metal translocating P-type ATPase [Caldicellulosiruptor kronotskyensis 2002]